MNTLGLSVDDVLTTTRTVRKRLDLKREVPREVLTQCLEIALQAPNGSNFNRWHWIVVDDPEMVRRIAAAGSDPAPARPLSVARRIAAGDSTEPQRPRNSVRSQVNERLRSLHWRKETRSWKSM